MSGIVGIHGIWNHRSDRPSMKAVWEDSLRRGLSNVRFPAAESVEVECVFYGHMYNDGKGGAADLPSIGDLDAGVEADLLEELQAGTGGGLTTDKSGSPDKGGTAALRLFDHLPPVVAFRLIKQVGRYLRDEEFADKVHGEVSQAMATAPDLVVAHSLGSVVIYRWLLEHRPPHPLNLITLGSPLGTRTIRKALGVKRSGSLSPRPEGILEWVNVAEPRDPVAMYANLDKIFQGGIVDLPANNPLRAIHDATSYLKNVNTCESAARLL